MDKLTQLLKTIDELVEQKQKNFDLAMAAEATATDEDEKRARGSNAFWAECEYRDAKKIRDFIVEAIS